MLNTYLTTTITSESKISPACASMRAGLRFALLSLCYFGTPLKVAILVPSLANAAENLASDVATSHNIAAQRRRGDQGKAKLDQAGRLDKQAEQYVDDGKYLAYRKLTISQLRRLTDGTPLTKAKQRRHTSS